MAKIRCCGVDCELPSFIDMRGLLSFWLLWELRNGSLNGVQLAERLAMRRGDPVSPGTLYPALAGLTKARLVKKQTSGRETRYELTPKGASDLDCAAIYLRVVMADVFEPQARLLQLRRA